MMPTVLKTSQSATGIADRGDHQSKAQLRSRWIGMNSAMMCNYIKFCADRLLIAFGCRCHYKVGNPYEWMETIRLALESTAWTKLLLLTPASDGNEHTHIQNAYYIDQETPSNILLSHMCLLPRLYGNKHQTCEQEVTIKSNYFSGEVRRNQALSGSLMINKTKQN